MLRFAKRAFRSVFPRRETEYSGAHSRNWWATRDAAGQSSAQSFWEGRGHPARAMIAAAVAAVPGSSLLEIGVHAGPTTWAICQKKKFARIAGTELSETILSFTRKTLPDALGQDVELVQASADNLPFSDKAFDVTVTNLVLVCIGPDEIDKSLSEIIRVTKGHIVLGEPKAASAPSDGKDLYPNTTYWIRNYADRLRGKADLISAISVPAEIRLGHLDEIAVFRVL